MILGPAPQALVNHSLGGDVTSGYIVMTPERLREPAQRVCDRLKTLCGTGKLRASPSWVKKTLFSPEKGFIYLRWPARRRGLQRLKLRPRSMHRPVGPAG